MQHMEKQQCRFSVTFAHWKGMVINMKRENSKSGIYITACCLAIIAAVVGFAGKKGKNSDSEIPSENTPVLQEELSESEPVKEVEKRETEIEDTKKATAKTAKKTESTETTHFLRPVDGKVLEEFSDNNLIYNEALRDWRTHDGVDLEADSGTQVLAAANGIVEKVFDSNMGKCVEISHQNGYKTVYANLDENIQIKAGDEVAEGDVIGLVGNTALGDITDLPHLHFEISKNGQNLNPAEYLD